MYLIEIDTRKFDFEGVSHEEYLEFFWISRYTQSKGEFICCNKIGASTSGGEAYFRQK